MDLVGGMSALRRAVYALASAAPLAAGVTHLYVAAMRCDRIWRNARLATMAPGAQAWASSKMA